MASKHLARHAASCEICIVGTSLLRLRSITNETPLKPDSRRSIEVSLFFYGTLLRNCKSLVENAFVADRGFVNLI